MSSVSSFNELVDNRDFLYGKLRRDFRSFFRHHHHLFEPHSPLERLAMLGFQSETHSWFDFDREIKRIDARDDRRVVLRQTKAVAPEIRRRLIFFLVSPSLHRR